MRTLFEPSPLLPRQVVKLSVACLPVRYLNTRSIRVARSEEARLGATKRHNVASKFQAGRRPRTLLPIESTTALKIKLKNTTRRVEMTCDKRFPTSTAQLRSRNVWASQATRSRRASERVKTPQGVARGAEISLPSCHSASLPRFARRGKLFFVAASGASPLIWDASLAHVASCFCFHLLVSYPFYYFGRNERN